MFAYFVLGIVQGLTEFLPVSSSGHLILARELFRFELVDPAFNVFVQGGTVLSVLIYFRTQILHLSQKYLKLILIASVPAALIGLLLGDYIDQIFTSLWGVALGFALTTIFVLLSRHPHKKSVMLDTKSATITGFSQALAILPGLSRSGSTITTSLLLGIAPAEAFTFSFLLSVPAIAGASLLSLRSLTWNSDLALSYLLGFFVATLTGYFSLVILAKLVRKGQFYLFTPYTATLAILSLYLALTR